MAISLPYSVDTVLIFSHGACHQVAIAGTTILVPCDIAKSLQFIWILWTHRFLQIRCSGLTHGWLFIDSVTSCTFSWGTIGTWIQGTRTTVPVMAASLTGPVCSLQWRHNEHYSVSNHQPQDCLLNRLFGRRSKKTSKLRVIGLCAGNSPGTGEFLAQMASNAENVSIWWHHHVYG